MSVEDLIERFPLGQYRGAGGRALCRAPMTPSRRKSPHMTRFGHCITNVTSALKALPPAGQLMLINDLRGFLDRQE
jgi:hypothetical protein